MTTSMGRERLEGDNRSFIRVVQGRRLIEAVPQVPKPGIAEFFNGNNRNRKLLRITGEDAEVIRRLARAADQVDELSFQERRAFLITESEKLILNGSIRVRKVLGLRERSHEEFADIVGKEDRGELFMRARGLAMPEAE